VKPKCLLVAVVTCLALMGATPALTASRQVQDLCSKQALRANATFRQRGEREAFMATCIANHTPTQRDTKVEIEDDGLRLLKRRAR
jgi:hypothetical protein